MRKGLGSILVLLFLTVCINASTYEWNMEMNKTTAVTNEAIYLKYTCTFSDESELYVIEFNPVVDNDEYTIELLSEDEKILDKHRVNTYEFVLFVKKAGLFTLALDTLMKKTNKDSIENTVLGRDNADYEEYSKELVKQKEIKLDIKDAKSTLVGTFTLDVKKDEEGVKEFEPYHMEILIRGRGSFKEIKRFVFDIDGVKVFQEDPKMDIKLTKNGYEGLWSQKFAFVADKNFTIPSIELNYFDLTSHSVRELKFQELKVDVKKNEYAKEELLDKEEDGFELKKEYIYYLLIFIAGYLFSKIEFKRFFKINEDEDDFCLKLKQVTSKNELAILLASHDAKKFDSFISFLETSKKVNINKIINEICKLIDN